jgi:hypothetical protein
MCITFCSSVPPLSLFLFLAGIIAHDTDHDQWKLCAAWLTPGQEWDRDNPGFCRRLGALRSG